MKIAIIGTGFKGMMDAYLLSEVSGISVTMYDSSAAFGGISGSFKWGDYYVDKGVHMFDSVQKEVVEIVGKISDGAFDYIDFISCSAFGSRLTQGFSLPNLESIDQCTKDKINEDLLELAKNPLRSQRRQESATSFEDLLGSRYGPTAAGIFADIFYNIYHLEARHADSCAMNRTSLGRLKFLDDQSMIKLKSDPYLDTILAARRQSHVINDNFSTVYPNDGYAMGGFCDKLYRHLLHKNVTIKLGHVPSFQFNDDSVSISLNRDIDLFDHVIWSADKYDTLLNSLGIEISIDNFFHPTPMLFATLEVESKFLSNFTYFQNFTSGATSFRTSSSGCYGRQTKSNGYTFITAECPISIESIDSYNKEDICKGILSELIDFGLIHPNAQLHDANVIPLKSSFKVPLTGFAQSTSQLASSLHPFSRILSVHSPLLFFRRDLFTESQQIVQSLLSR